MTCSVRYAITTIQNNTCITSKEMKRRFLQSMSGVLNLYRGSGIRSRCLIKSSGRGGFDRISRIRQKQTTVFLRFLQSMSGVLNLYRGSGIRSRCLIKSSGRGGFDRISRIRQKQTTVFLSHWKTELRQFLQR